MGPNIGADLCRVTIIAPRTRVDVALPVDVPLADLLPTLLRYAGEELPDAGLVHNGWTLQRLGQPPLDTARSVSALAVRDGEILHFRPREAQLPEVAFDDVVDAIAAASRDRSDRWRPATTRAFAYATTFGALALAGLVLALSGPPWTVPAVVAAAVAAVAVVAGTALSRAVPDAGGGTVLGYAAVPLAFLAGLTALGGDRSLVDLGAAQLLVGAAAVMAAAAVAAAGVADGAPAFLGIAIAGAFTALAAMVDLLFGSLAPAGVAGLTVAVVLAATPLVPMSAFRLARLPLPVIPVGVEDLRRDHEAVSGADVLRQTSAADRYVTGLVGGLAAAGAGCEAFLARGSGWSPPVLCVVVAAALVLRARLFTGRAQRLWLLLSGLFGLVVLALSFATGDHGQAATLAAVLVPLLALAVTVTGAALRLGDRRPSPVWGRAVDLLELLVVLAVVPLALAVLDVYAKVRGLAG